jgi:hypothetical protein
MMADLGRACESNCSFGRCSSFSIDERGSVTGMRGFNPISSLIQWLLKEQSLTCSFQ